MMFSRVMRSMVVARTGFLLFGWGGLLPSRSAADYVVADKINYSGARITALAQGKLHFRVPDGTLRTPWIHEVDLIVVDREGAFLDFNEAERSLSDGDAAQALIRYRRALRLREDFWADLIAARMVLAAERAGRIDESVAPFLRALRGEAVGPAGAARFIPLALPKERTPEMVKALEQLDAALLADPTPPERAVIALFRFALLQSGGDPRTPESADALAAMELPSSVGGERVFAIVRSALEEAIRRNVAVGLEEALDRAIRDCPENLLPDFLWLKGRFLLAGATNREEIIRATWPLMRIVIHRPDHARTPQALHETATAMERLGRPDQAMALLQDCLRHPKTSEILRKQAEETLSRLQSLSAEPNK
jgi:tetratricopeptide (TPR) repeat protein